MTIDSIKRYTISGDIAYPIHEDPEGDYVTYEEHVAAIEADRKHHDRVLAHEWIRPALGLSEDAPYRFDFYAQEIEKLKADRQRKGEVVVTKDEAGYIVAVTRQDKEGRILSVIAEADRKRRGEPYAQLIVVDEDDEWPQLVYLKGVNLKPGLHDLFLSPQPSEIVATEAPLGAIENGRAFADRLENGYSFECQGGLLHNCSDWQEFRRCFEHLAEWALSQAPQPADRERRGEPAFYVNARIFDLATGKIKADVNGALTWSEKPAGNWQVPVYTAPQPTERSRGEPVAYLDLGVGGYMDLGTDLTDEQLAALPKGRHMLAIVGTYGVDGYTEADPPPAEPVKVPSDADAKYVQDFIACDGMGAVIVEGPQYSAVVRALFARYGNQTQEQP